MGKKRPATVEHSARCLVRISRHLLIIKHSLKNLSATSNHFVETALIYVFSYFFNEPVSNFNPAVITILADPDYYSRPLFSQNDAHSNSGRRGFLDFGVPLQDAHKTGLGSSAALVTAITAALLQFYSPRDWQDLEEDQTRSKLHRLAQIIHCAAQRKIGSGFDVAAATYGSCLYRRFSPSILEQLGTPESPNFTTRLKDLVDDRSPASKWDAEVLKDAVQLPEGIRLLMCDVNCGSQTVGMAKRVLAWRQERPSEAEALWKNLNAQNEYLGQHLAALEVFRRKKPEDYHRILQDAIHPAIRDSDLAGCLGNIKTTLSAIRGIIRRLSSETGVPIEPPPQTKLLDACSALPGVLGGVVPGAGGFDAITLLIVDDEYVIQKIETLCQTWEAEEGDEADATTSNVRVLGIREDMEGIRVEHEEKYKDWIQYS